MGDAEMSLNRGGMTENSRNWGLRTFVSLQRPQGCMGGCMAPLCSWDSQAHLCQLQWRSQSSWGQP